MFHEWYGFFQTLDFVDLYRNISVKWDFAVHESFSVHEALLVSLVKHRLGDIQLAFRRLRLLGEVSHSMVADLQV